MVDSPRDSMLISAPAIGSSEHRSVTLPVKPKIDKVVRFDSNGLREELEALILMVKKGFKNIRLKVREVAISNLAI